MTGQTFVPRGNNYIELAPQTDPRGNNPSTYHSTFNPGVYSTDRVERAVQRMAADGYNTVRVFLNGLADSEPGPRISVPYLLNFSDFLVRAKAHGLFVIVTRDAPPFWFQVSFMEGPGKVIGTGSFNSLYTAAGLAAAEAGWRDLITGLQAIGAPLDQVLGYESALFFDGATAPFSVNSGSFSTPDGRTYDLSIAAEKQRLAAQWAVYWLDTLRAAVLDVDPTALFGNAFDMPPDANDKRIYPIRAVQDDQILGGSHMDFIDLHPYPGWLSLDQYMKKFNVAVPSSKPLLMGEFGLGDIVGGNAGDPPREAALLQDWQIASCAYGFSGWLLWTWADALAGAGSPVDVALRPIDRPDPCRTVVRQAPSPSPTSAAFVTAAPVLTVAPQPTPAPLVYPVNIRNFTVFHIGTLEREVPSDGTIDIAWGWGVMTADCRQQYIDGLAPTLTLGGRQIPLSIELTTNANGGFGVRWHALAAALAPGRYTATLREVFTKTVCAGDDQTVGGTTNIAERVIVVTPKELYPQFKYSGN